MLGAAPLTSTCIDHMQMADIITIPCWTNYSWPTFLRFANEETPLRGPRYTKVLRSPPQELRRCGLKDSDSSPCGLREHVSLAAGHKGPRDQTLERYWWRVIRVTWNRLGEWFALDFLEGQLAAWLFKKNSHQVLSTAKWQGDKSKA